MTQAKTQPTKRPPGRPKGSLDKTKRRVYKRPPKVTEITHEEAFARYCEMGPKRTIANLALLLNDDPDVSPKPTFKTLRNWASDGDWQARARQFDTQKGQVAQRRALERAADGMVNLAEDVEIACHETLARYMENLNKVASPQAALDLAGKLVDIRDRLIGNGALEPDANGRQGNNLEDSAKALQHLAKLAEADPDGQTMQ